MVIKIPLIISTGELECVAGDDVTLLYYYQCKACKTVVITDNSERFENMSKYKCPICFPEEHKNYPYEYVTFDKIDNYMVSWPYLSFLSGKIEKGKISLKERLEMGFLENKF